MKGISLMMFILASSLYAFSDMRGLEQARDVVREFQNICVDRTLTVAQKKTRLLKYLNSADVFFANTSTMIHVGLSNRRVKSRISLARNFVKTEQFGLVKSLGDSALDEIHRLEQMN